MKNFIFSIETNIIRLLLICTITYNVIGCEEYVIGRAVLNNLGVIKTLRGGTHSSKLRKVEYFAGKILHIIRIILTK